MDSLYQYELPPEQIAREPAEPRDHSRLLIYKTATDEIIFDSFFNVAKYLPAGSFLVMNETKVLPARMHAERDGEEIELLVIPSEANLTLGTVKATANKRLRKGQKVFLTPKHALEVTEDTEKAFTFKAHFDLKELPSVLLEHGETPIPNYIQGSPLTEAELREKYQTVFAKNPGAVAAPTASLHFTKRVFQDLERVGTPQLFVTLHVGLGTFAPVLPEHLENRTLYEECFEIEANVAEKIRAYKKEGRLCTAVGTTVVRTLESFAQQQVMRAHEIELQNKTNLFILPPFDFQMVDQLLTNFHLPGSSLMMLVEAFLQHKGAKRHLKEIYEIAIKQGFRFYSFGDAMLIV